MDNRDKIKHSGAICVAALFTTALSAIWHRLFFRGQVPADGNLLSLFYPARMFFRSAIAAHSLPLWNPLKNMGEPLLADPQAMMLYPPAWLAFLLPYLMQVQFWIIFHSALIFFFVYKTAARHCGANRIPAAGAAFFAAFNPLVLAKATFPVYLAALSWLPAAFYFLLGENAVGFTASMALMWLSGFPPYFIIAAMLLGATALAGGKKKTLFYIRWTALSLAVCAAQILPFLQMLFSSTRGATAAQNGMFSATPSGLLTQLFVPPYIKTPDFGLDDPSILSFYAGIPALALAAFAAWRGGRRERLGAAAALALLFLALGPRTRIYSLLPFNALFRFPAHWLMPAVFIIALLCARGLALIGNKRMAALATVLLCADMFGAGLCQSGFAWSRPEFFTDPPQAALTVPAGGRIYHTAAYMDAVAKHPLYKMDDYMRLRETLFPSYGAALGMAEARSNQIMPAKKYAGYIARMEGSPQRQQLLDDAGIALVIDAKPTPPGPQVSFYRNPAAKPLVRYDAPLPPPAHTSKAGYIRIDSVLDSPQRLVAAQVYYPGWKAYVDGKRTVIEDFDGAFLSVTAPAGKHLLEFRYRPAAFYIGLCISIAALVFLAKRAVIGFIGWIILRRLKDWPAT